MKKYLIVLLLILQLPIWAHLWAAPTPREHFSFEELKKIAIQDHGRVKPLDTLARETVLWITGRQRFRKWDATELILSWLVYPYNWQTEDLIIVEDKNIKKRIGLPDDQKRFSFEELTENQELKKWLGSSPTENQ